MEGPVDGEPLVGDVLRVEILGVLAARLERAVSDPETVTGLDALAEADAVSSLDVTDAESLELLARFYSLRAAADGPALRARAAGTGGDDQHGGPPPHPALTSGPERDRTGPDDGRFADTAAALVLRSALAGAADTGAVGAVVDNAAGIVAGTDPADPAEEEVDLSTPTGWARVALLLHEEDPSDPQDAVAVGVMLRLALQRLHADDPDRPGIVRRAALIALRTQELLGWRSHAADAERWATEDLANAAAGTERAEALSRLALAQESLSGHDHRGDPLAESVRTMRQALQQLPTDDPDRPSYLNNLGLLLRHLAVATDDLPLLRAAIRAGQQALSATPDGAAGAAPRWSNLSAAYRELAERDDSADSGRRALTCALNAVRAADGDDPYLPALLVNLGAAYQAWYYLSSDPEAITSAIAASRAALHGLEDGTALRLRALDNLSRCLLSLYSTTGDRPALQEAVERAEQALDATTPDTDGHVDRQVALAAALLERYEVLGAAGDLAAARRLTVQAVSSEIADPDRVSTLLVAGTVAQTVYHATGEVTELECGEEFLRSAADIALPGSSDSAAVASTLAAVLLDRVERTGDAGVADLLTEAEALARRAVETTDPARVAYPARLANLSLVVQQLAAMPGGGARTAEAVELSRGALDATAGQSPDRPSRQSNLSLALRLAAARGGDERYWDEAVELAAAAVTATADGSPDRPGLLGNLGLARLDRYERRADPEDLDEAERAARAAAGIPAGIHGGTVADRDAGGAVRLSNLSLVLLSRFEASGRMAILDEATDVAVRAVRAVSPGHADRPRLGSNAGNTLSRRYDLTGDVADLDEAIVLFRTAARDAAHDQRSRALIAGNLGTALTAYTQRTGDPATADEAVDAARLAITLVDDEDPDRPLLLTNLGNALQVAFSRVSRPGSLEEAITVVRQAVEATPADHPDLPARLSNLSVALRTLHERHHEPRALVAAIASARQAVEHPAARSPDGTDSPEASVYWHVFGEALETAAGHPDSGATYAEASAAFARSAGNDAGPPYIRARSAASWGVLAAVLDEIEEARHAFTLAVELLDVVIAASLARPDQEYRLQHFAGLATDAGACAALLGDALGAVTLLERARGVLIGRALDLRPDIDDVPEQHAHLATEYREVCTLLSELPAQDALSRPTTQLEQGLERRAWRGREVAEHRRALWRRHDELADALRRLNVAEFGTDVVADLGAATVAGPLVMVNTSRFHPHALIVTSGAAAAAAAPVLGSVPARHGGSQSAVVDGNGATARTADTRTGRRIAIRILPLPDLEPSELQNQVHEFAAALADLAEPAAARPVSQPSATLSATLEWLWEAVARPVLEDGLGLRRPPPPGAPWPRVWWCTTGSLAFMPVHAAGRGPTEQEPDASVLDRVVSSYAPTARALAHGRRPCPEAPAEVQGALVVAMGRTDGASDLPGAVWEEAAVRGAFPEGRTLLAGNAGAEQVLDQLSRHPWVHFACHTRGDATSPSNVQLLVDGGHTALTVSEMSRRRLEHADAAVLSSCVTARPAAALLDESINLAAAFQLAGYRHVVAALWPITDRHAVTVSRHIYAAVAAAAPQCGDALAEALHEATRGLRSHWRDWPSVWAGHVHVGI